MARTRPVPVEAIRRLAFHAIDNCKVAVPFTDSNGDDDERPHVVRDAHAALKFIGKDDVLEQCLKRVTTVEFRPEGWSQAKVDYEYPPEALARAAE
jgi:hypothetical protein